MGIDDIYQLAAKKRDRRVKIFGERNTGTRAVIRMLRALNGVTVGFPNYPMPDLDLLEKRINDTLTGFHFELYKDALDDIRRSRLKGLSAWKHAAPVVDDSYAAKAASVLFLVRDPYSWIAALYRNPYHMRAPKPDSLEAFLEQPWLSVQRENIEPVMISPMMVWNAKMRAYRAFAKAAPVPSTVLYFEEFVLDPVSALAAALARFGISGKGLKEIEDPTKTAGVSRAERLRYYRESAWEKEISPEAAHLINTYVDWDAATSFGYAMRDPAEF